MKMTKIGVMYTGDDCVQGTHSSSKVYFEFSRKPKHTGGLDLFIDGNTTDHEWDAAGINGDDSFIYELVRIERMET